MNDEQLDTESPQCPECGGRIVYGEPYAGSYCDDCGHLYQGADGEIQDGDSA